MDKLQEENKFVKINNSTIVINPTYQTVRILFEIVRKQQDLIIFFDFNSSFYMCSPKTDSDEHKIIQSLTGFDKLPEDQYGYIYYHKDRIKEHNYIGYQGICGKKLYNKYRKEFDVYASMIDSKWIYDPTRNSFVLNMDY